MATPRHNEFALWSLAVQLIWYLLILIKSVQLIFKLVALIWLKHDDVIKWKYFPRYWSFVRGIHRSPVNSPHKGQWRGALMFSLICPWTNGWVNNRKAGDLRRYSAHYDVIAKSSLRKGHQADIHHPPHYVFKDTSDAIDILGGVVVSFWIAKPALKVSYLTSLLWRKRNGSAANFTDYLNVSCDSLTVV